MDTVVTLKDTAATMDWVHIYDWVYFALVTMSSSSGSTASNTADENADDRVRECLKYVSIYSKGAFSCSSADDDDDDEDVKRILAEHDEPEPRDGEIAGFSSCYEAVAAEVAAETGSSPLACCISDRYENWDEALRDTVMVYPPLGVGRSASGTSKTRKLFVLRGDMDPQPADRAGSPSSSAQLLRKCLEGALYGQDTEEFAVAQPYCAANKNLDFGKSKMSPGAVQDSRKRVENWMSKYYVVADHGQAGVESGHWACQLQVYPYRHYKLIKYCYYM